MTVVLDASALLSFLQAEPGSHQVEAELAGRLWQQTRQAGLPLGDRACLSTGIRMNVSVLTADQIWTTLNLPVVVRCIR